MLPYYFIPIKYFTWCLKAGDFCVPQKFHYDKRLKLNRCRLASSQGALDVSVPLINGRNQRTPLHEIQIDFTRKWVREHIHSIKTVYGKAPYFLFYCDPLFYILQEEERSFTTMSVKLMNEILGLLKMPERVTISDKDTLINSEEIKLIPFQYHQLFEERTGFIEGCSILDLLFNYGPDTAAILKRYSLN